MKFQACFNGWFPRPFSTALWTALLLWVALTGGQGQDANLAVLRAAALDDVFILKDFRPGKNSFVENAERHPGAWTGIGYRHTLLDVKGQGSVRHIWTTRGDGESYFDWEFYVDGETTPSLRATDVELVRAAAQFQIPVAPANSVPLGNRDFNFFLPVPFEKSLRIEVVQRQTNYWLWFCQIDYRLEDDSLKGVRLTSQRTGAGLKLNYVGLGEMRISQAGEALNLTTHVIESRSINPGTAVSALKLEGPALVRELRLKSDAPASVQLGIRYDDAHSLAVRSPVDRFFGPFQGVSFYRHATNDSSCYLPMPFRKNFELVLSNTSPQAVSVEGKVVCEQVPAFAPSWGYFHALHQKTDLTDGHRLHQVLYVKGRGHWLGMALYRTGHDHGGGDFAVVDGAGENPAFLHGVNGEDYFTFAWFGKGAHHPYAVAHSNDEGRYRHHFENVYPFQKSLALEWGAFPRLSPESVAVWYQDTPEDTTLPDGARAESVEWQVFGPVPVPDGVTFASGDYYRDLPSVKDLDAGRRFACRLVKEKFTGGWMKEWSVGSMLNLTYIGRHGTEISYEAELGGAGHAMLARRFVEAARDQIVTCHFAHDDPIEVWVNGTRVYEGRTQLNGFETMKFPVPLKTGKNEMVVRLTHYFNRNFNWAGFWMRLADEPAHG